MPKVATGQTDLHEGPRRAAERQRRAALVVAFPKSAVLPLPISGEPVGREWLASLGSSDSRVSTRHIVFTRPGGGLFVEDVGSRNGTWVNGSRLSPGERVGLCDGAILRVGRTLLVYREDFVGTDAPSPPLGALVAPFGLRRVTEAIAAIGARRPTNVLIQGETGTGKELVALEVARAAGRANRYAPVNVAGMATGVFESQLFGYVPGAYSGSGKGSPGIFVANDGGAVFLDEIGELPLDLQAKLLRVLDNREVLPVGATKPTKVDLLIISATNRSLEDDVAAGTFRRDLHARLSASAIQIPPLRDRAEDLFAILLALAETHRITFAPTDIEVEAVEQLMLHAWPSNVRELASVVERAALVKGSPSLRLEFVESVLGARVEPSGTTVTREQVQQALAEAGGNESEAARRLGVSRGKLRRLLQASGT
jgi:transcriptional regulator with AAA-type ATPase domain